MKNLIFYKLPCVLALLLFVDCQGLFAQEGNIVGKVVTIENNDTISVPTVHVIAYQLDEPSGNNIEVAAVTTDSTGNFSLSLPKSTQMYNLYFSYIGYKTQNKNITLNQDRLFLSPIILHVDTLLLNEVRVEQSLKSQSFDNRSYIFTANQKTKSINTLQLVAQLPGLRIDRTTNKLTPISGGDVMILINGLPASVNAIRALSPKNVKRAIVYDVPPAEYNASGYLINLIVDYPNNSTSGDINLTAGNLYSSFDPVITHVSKKNMWTFELSSHWNPKNRFDYSNGTETYSLPDKNTIYNMNKKEQMHSISLLPSLSYLYNGNKVRLIAKVASGLYNEQEESFSSYSDSSATNIIEHKLNNKIKNRSVEADMYVQYNIHDKSNILFSSNASLNNNQQELNSLTKENNPDFQDLKIDRKGFINELVYRNFIHSVKFTSGIRSSFLRTEYENKENPYFSKRLLNTLYSEFWGKYNSFTYRGSLFLNHEHNKTPIESFQIVNFTPKWLLSYTINPEILLRYRGNVSARRPVSQELSNISFKISPLMYKTGNPNLRNEINYNNELLLRITKSKWQFDWYILTSNQINPIVVSYELANVDGRDVIIKQPINEKKIDKYETDLYFNMALFNENLNLSVDTRLAYFSLERAGTEKKFNMWLPRISVALSYIYKELSFDYYQTLFGKDISDLIIADLEKISYVSAGYRKGNLSLNASLFFPFGKNSVDMKTIQEVPYQSEYLYRMQSKERTFAISLSYFFGDVDKRLNDSRVINNSDDNKGILNIK